VALVPPHRETQGGFPDLSVRDNMTVSALHKWAELLGLLNVGREKREADEMVRRLAVKPGDPNGEYGVLSGGNKQKVVFGRAVLRDPDVYVLCEPTRGVDVATRAAIYELISELRGRGAALLVISSDGEDLLSVCDRLAVVVDGRLAAVPVPVDDLDPAHLEAIF
jgi:ribose transport system ATP-binding protein